MKILLVHHTPYHFEVTLAFYQDIRSTHQVSLYSTHIHMLNRHELIKLCNISMHHSNFLYDLVVIITGEVPIEMVDEDVVRWVRSIPVIKLQHDFGHTLSWDTMFLFPGAPGHFIPADLGFDFSSIRKPRQLNKPCQFLIQGNVESRRNYDIIAQLVELCPNTHYNIVGSTSSLGELQEKLKNPRISFHLNLDERTYHEVCAQSHFILPLIEPEGFPRYFQSAFTTSVLVGLTHQIPFVAHEKIFELYTLAGLSYHSNMQLPDIINTASGFNDSTYASLRTQMLSLKQMISEQNRVQFGRSIARLGADQSISRFTSLYYLINPQNLGWNRSSDTVVLPLQLFHSMLRPALSWVPLTSSNEATVKVSKQDFASMLRPWLIKIRVDEAWYKRRYLAPASTEISAAEHFVTEGYFQGLLPVEVEVDEEFYLSTYPDVAEAVKNGWHHSAKLHFEDHGFVEGRRPNSSWLAWDVYKLT